jgi:transcriptional regulator with XRE-family HTH domain
MDKRYYNQNALKKIREAVFTQEELAKKINRHVKTISRAEAGKHASLPLLAEMTNACGRSVKEVIYDFPMP